MTVALQELTSANWEECSELRVREDQADNVDSNLYCIAESRFETHWELVAIHAGQTMVGLVVFGDVGDGACVIHHLMIDHRYQGRGYGRAAMLEVIHRLNSRSDCRSIELSYWPGNPAARMYERLGFEHTGELWDDEPVMRLVTNEP